MINVSKMTLRPMGIFLLVLATQCYHSSSAGNNLRGNLREGDSRGNINWYLHYVNLAALLNKTNLPAGVPQPEQITFSQNTVVKIPNSPVTRNSRTLEDIVDEFGFEVDHEEIARQNRITEQIVQNYLEKRFFPHRPSKAPSVWEILPARKRRRPSNNIQEVLNRTSDKETLESGESEQVASVYADEEGTYI